MSEVFLERTFAQAINVDTVRQMAEQLYSCLDIYNAAWRQSYLSSDGSKLYCHFQAPDAEAVRNLLHYNNNDFNVVWQAEYHDTGKGDDMNVVVERNWNEPVRLEDIAAIEEDHAWCLDTRNVTYLRTYFSSDHKRMICMYRAPDAESVRQAQHEAGMPFDDVWSFTHLTAALVLPS